MAVAIYRKGLCMLARDADLCLIAQQARTTTTFIITNNSKTTTASLGSLLHTWMPGTVNFVDGRNFARHQEPRYPPQCIVVVAAKKLAAVGIFFFFLPLLLWVLFLSGHCRWIISRAEIATVHHFFRRSVSALPSIDLVD